MIKVAEEFGDKRVLRYLEELDEEVLEAVLVDELEDDASLSGHRGTEPDITLVKPENSAAKGVPPPPGKGVPPPAKEDARPPQASYDVWHEAVEDVTGEFKRPTTGKRRS